MPNVVCVKSGCGFVLGEEVGVVLRMPGRNPIKSPASFGCEVCGTLQTWIAGQGTKLANHYTRPAGQPNATPTEIVR